MKNKPQRNPDVNKATAYAIAVNAIQIVVLAAFVFYVIFGGEKNNNMLLLIVIIGAVMAAWGALIDIREAIGTRKRERTISELETTNRQMDQLNLKMRAQRHDFLNHIQVVYSLLEMGENQEAVSYLDRIYNELKTVNRVLRTKMTAFNALLQVKSAACEERGITFDMDIRSTLEGMPVPPWEMCCIIGNLVDNAIDAVSEEKEPHIRLTVTEDLRGFTFRIENNGKQIPASLQDKIFEPGVSTKGEGHGMGLSIVRKTLRQFGGNITLQSKNKTAFIVTLPRSTEETSA